MGIGTSSGEGLLVLKLAPAWNASVYHASLIVNVNNALVAPLRRRRRRQLSVVDNNILRRPPLRRVADPFAQNAPLLGMSAA